MSDFVSRKSKLKLNCKFSSIFSVTEIIFVFDYIQHQNNMIHTVKIDDNTRNGKKKIPTYAAIAKELNSRILL